jgi:uncharacterized membrane protein YdjX (TVP38/TMEM64 family)
MSLLEIFFLVFGVSVLQEIIFILPSTATSVVAGTLFADYALTTGNFILFILAVVLPISLGMAVGSIPAFLLVKHGFTWIERRFDFLDIIIHQARNMAERRPKNIYSFFFVLRALPVFSGLVVTFMAGLVGMPLSKYLVWSFLGTMVRGTMLAYAGWQLSIFASQFSGDYGLAVLALSIVTVAGTLWYFGRGK